jgi:TatD DNase family protein
MLVDSHCHLTHGRFQDDRRGVLVRAGRAGIGKILIIASDRADAEEIGRWLDAERGGGEIPKLWGSAGIHPHEAEGAVPGDLDRIRDLARNHAGIVAIGETGLDFFYDNSPREVQEGLFRDHMELANELDMPIVVHSRSADSLTGRILEEWKGRVRGVLHCYSGNEDLLETALGSDWMISFTGMITFKKYDGHALVRRVPKDRLMVETDAPYLAPVPHRGKRNEPAFVAQVAEGLARIRGENLQDVEGYTTANAVRFFGLVS